MKSWGERSTVFIIFFGMMAIGGLVIGLASRNIVGIVLGGATLVYIGKEVYDRFFPPAILSFKTSPKLHFDELSIAQSMVKGVTLPNKDPVVVLPTLQMRIPRRWFGQQGMIDFMSSLSDLDWNVQDRFREDKRRYSPGYHHRM
jgi:hypothetical protein